jgi:hypothetical protein
MHRGIHGGGVEISCVCPQVPLGEEPDYFAILHHRKAPEAADPHHLMRLRQGIIRADCLRMPPHHMKHSHGSFLRYGLLSATHLPCHRKPNVAEYSLAKLALIGTFLRAL